MLGFSVEQQFLQFLQPEATITIEVSLATSEPCGTGSCTTNLRRELVPVVSVLGERQAALERTRARPQAHGSHFAPYSYFLGAACHGDPKTHPLALWSGRRGAAPLALLPARSHWSCSSANALSEKCALFRYAITVIIKIPVYNKMIKSN